MFNIFNKIKKENVKEESPSNNNIKNAQEDIQNISPNKYVDQRESAIVSPTAPIIQPVSNFQGINVRTEKNDIESLPPPKNLPDLARDLFGGVYEADSLKDNRPKDFKKPSEPETKNHIPNLDINLLKKSLPQTSSIHQEKTTVSVISHVSESPSVNQATISENRINVDPRINPQIASSQNSAHNIYNLRNSMDIPGSFQNKSFFKDFENFILLQDPKDINKNVMNELLNGNSLEKLYLYHNMIYSDSWNNVKSDFVELQHLEYMWIKNKEKEFVFKKMSEEIDGEILLKSERLKKNISVNSDLNVVLSNTQHASSSSRLPVEESGERAKIPVQFLPVRKIDSVPENFYTTNSASFLSNSTYALYNNIISDSSKYFYGSDGTIIRSIKELISALMIMNENTFNNHVNSIRNDFANWINEVFNQPELANKMRSIYSRDDLVNLLMQIFKM